MCISCGGLMVFNKDLTLRKPTAEESAQLESVPAIIEAQLARAWIVGDKLKKQRR
jgi:hypothetical protein